MKISTKGRYALRFMIDLVQNGGDSYTSLKDVTRRQTISPKYLEQIATSLSKSGLILSVRGPQGGYKLARSPWKNTPWPTYSVLLKGHLPASPVSSKRRMPAPVMKAARPSISGKGCMKS